MRPLSFRTAHPASPSGAECGQQARSPTVWLVRQPRQSLRGSAEAQRPDSLVLARSIMRQMGLSEAERIVRDASGRPTLPAASGLDLSISHSASVWMLALSNGGRRVGVDIEGPRQVPRAIELAERYFPATEVGILKRLAPISRERAFLRLWCVREAMLKAHGRGIAFGLSRLSFSFSHDAIELIDCDPALGIVADWRVREFTPASGMLGAVAWRGPPAVLRGVKIEVGSS